MVWGSVHGGQSSTAAAGKGTAATFSTEAPRARARGQPGPVTGGQVPQRDLTRRVVPGCCKPRALANTTGHLEVRQQGLQRHAENHGDATSLGRCPRGTGQEAPQGPGVAGLAGENGDPAPAGAPEPRRDTQGHERD